MKNNMFALGMAGALFAIPMNANAASLNAVTQNALGSTCSSDFANVGSVMASCGSFVGGDGIDTRASYGSLGVRSQVDGPSAFGSGSQPQDDDFWRGGAATRDTLNFSVQSGTFRLFTDIAATLIEQVTGSFGGSSLPFGRNIFAVDVNSSTIFQRDHVYSNPTGPIATLTSTNDFGNTGRGFVDIAFTGGHLDLVVNLFTEARCGAQHVGNIANKTGTCLLGVDAFNSIRLIGGTVFDDNGSEVVGGYLNSDSGFDYSVGVAPHGPAPIPLPASAVLVLTGLAGFGAMRRRKLP